MAERTKSTSLRSAWRFVALMGIVSLFADMTYEGARSLTGQFLALLGAGAAVIGIVAGMGEFLGYAFRLVAGIVADRTGRYWGLTFLGYAVNVLSVPTLALAGRWETAAGLVFAERLGKALRTPARDAMLSHAASQMGRGLAFGIHEALDQLGAILGPLLMAFVLRLWGDYRTAFATLLVPAALTLTVLTIAWWSYPAPQHLELEGASKSSSAALPSAFWRYLAFAAFAVAGFPHFQLLAYHFKAVQSLPEPLIPAAFGLAMATDAMAALWMGRWFDRFGLMTLIVVPTLTLFAALLLFTSRPNGAWLGMVLWGIVMGAQESIMRAAIAAMTPSDRRATAYGIFNAAYGLAWLMGGTLMGFLYDRHRFGWLLAFIAITQLFALPLLLSALRRRER
jgi:MFS family permease